MKFRTRDGFQFEVGGVKGVAITKKTDLNSGSVAYLRVQGLHGKTKTILSDRFYFVVDGAGLFTMAGKNLEVEAQDRGLVGATSYFPGRCRGASKACFPTSV